MKNIRNAFLFILSVCTLFIFTSCALSGGGEDTERVCTTHMWDVGSVQREATCFEEGEYIYHCLYCSQTKLESIPQLEHTYYDDWIDDEEYHYHLCYLCSQDVKDKEAHSWDEGVVIEATCTQRGSVTYTCTVCFYTKTEEIPELEHTYSNEWTIDEWQHYHASTCGCEDKRAGAENHKWDGGVVITPATCVEDGSALHTCTVCSATKVFTLRRTYEHIWDDGVVTPPTCTDMGYTTHTCTVCGHSVEGSYVGSISHEYIPSVTAPTCTEEGYTTYTCSGCSNSYKSNYVAKTGHSYATKVVSPTCSARGYTLHTCTACGDSYQDTYTDRPPHDYEVYFIKEPTCTARGYTIYECSVCFYKHYDDYTSIIPHPYESVVIEPTCTAMGYTVYTCSACADTYTADYTDIIDHDYEFVSATESTCTESGYRSYACVDCGATTGYYLGKLPHDYESEVIAPTCIAEGYTLHTCTVCGTSYSDTRTAMTAHTYSDIICTYCGKHEYSIGLSYSMGADGSYYIIEGIGECEDTDLVIPNVHYGKPVRIIAASAFKDNTDITSVLFMPGETQQTIEEYAFSGCTNLSTVTLGQVHGVEKYAFLGSGLTELQITDNVYTVDDFAFMNCRALTSVNIGKQTFSIGIGVFAGCSELSVITVDALNEVYSASGNCLIYKQSGSILAGCKTSKIPTDASITRISSYAFYGLTSLETFYIPANITFISAHAFAECTSMTHIYFGSDEHWFRTENLGEAEAKSGGIEYVAPSVGHWNADLLAGRESDLYWYRK